MEQPARRWDAGLVRGPAEPAAGDPVQGGLITPVLPPLPQAERLTCPAPGHFPVSSLTRLPAALSWCPSAPCPPWGAPGRSSRLTSTL